MDRATCVTATPFGTFELSATAHHLVQVGWTRRRSTARPKHAVLRQAVDQLERFAAGQQRAFSISISLEAVRGAFHRRVLEILQRDIGFGKTVSYGELAALAGRPRAARAVGTAMNKNPLPVFVPCHRVLASTGLGGFAPGLEMKRRLLRHEGFDC